MEGRSEEENEPNCLDFGREQRAGLFAKQVVTKGCHPL